MKIYEVATLDIAMGSNAKVFAGIEEFTTRADSGGRLLACWYADVGALNRVMVIRGFGSAEEAVESRQRLLLSADPFGVADHLTGLSLDSYAPFPFLPAVEPGELGPFYEVRVYGIKPTGLAATIEAWKNAVPARTAISPLTVAMYSLDGNSPRFMNIWPYPDLNARQAARSQAVAEGIWPPKGGPQHLTTLDSAFYLPAPFSPLG